MKPPPHPPPPAVPKSIISSPGRPEKLPAPALARLLRGSRSTRARSSPMFVSRTKSLNRSTSSSALAAAAADGEPTSPKVTCIGQIRTRNRHHKHKTSKTKKLKKDPKSSPLPAPDHERSSSSSSSSSCLEQTLHCKFRFRLLPKRKRSSSDCCCRFFCWRKHHQHHANETAKELFEADAHNAPPIAFVGEMRSEVEESDDAEDEEEEETTGFVSSVKTTESPPVNALLLMRCRSAPHNRSSALSLCRFPITPVPVSESEDDLNNKDKENEAAGAAEEEETKIRLSSTTVSPPCPVGLTRCKSEPAKCAEKLMEVKEAGPTELPSAVDLVR